MLDKMKSSFKWLQLINKLLANAIRHINSYFSNFH